MSYFEFRRFASLLAVPFAVPFAVQIRKWLRKAPLQPVKTLDGVVVGSSGGALRDVRRDHKHDLLANVIEGEHFVEEEQAGVGDAQLVFGRLWQPLNLADRVIGKEADSSGGERRQSLQARRLVAAERVAKDGKDVAFNLRGLAALGDRDLASSGDDSFERREADEGVTAHLLAAFNRFEQKALALCPRRAEKGRDRRFQVGQEGAANGHEGVRPGEVQKLLAAGLGGSR